MALTYDCYVRVYVKCDSNGNIIEDYNDDSDDLHGHFDVQINKPDGDKLGLKHSKTVFSYGYRETDSVAQKGTLRVFNDSKTGQAMTPGYPYRLYYWHFQASESQVANFKTKLANWISSTTHTKTYYTWYDVTNSTFKIYNIETANCFRAAAYFTSWLGNDKLMSIYNDYKDWDKGYRNYFAWRMWVKYQQHWTGGKLYNG